MGIISWEQKELFIFRAEVKKRLQFFEVDSMEMSVYPRQRMGVSEYRRNSVYQPNMISKKGWVSFGGFFLITNWLEVRKRNGLYSNVVMRCVCNCSFKDTSWYTPESASNHIRNKVVWLYYIRRSIEYCKKLSTEEIPLKMFSVEDDFNKTIRETNFIDNEVFSWISSWKF